MKKYTLLFIFALITIPVVVMVFSLVNKKPFELNRLAPDFVETTQGFVAKNLLFEAKLPKNSKGTITIQNKKILSITPLNVAMAQAKTEENKILYPDAYPSSTVEYVTTSKGLKESIIIRSLSNLPKELSYIFSAQDLKAELQSDNSITFTQVSKEPSRDIPVSDGSVLPEEKAANFLPEHPKRFTIPSPLMIDAHGRKSETKDIEVIIRGNKLILRPNLDWLKNAAFPVILDPTVEVAPEIVEEIADKRALTSKTFLNDDGSYTSVLFENPIHYLENGKFKDIDRSIKNSNDPDQFEINSGFYKAKFKKNLTANTNRAIRVDFSDGEIAFTPQKIGWSNGDMLGTVQNVSGEIVGDGSILAYKSLFGVPGIDLEAIYDNEKFLKETVINNPQVIDVQNHSNDNLEITFALDLSKDLDLKVAGTIWDKTTPVITQDDVAVLNNGSEVSRLRKAIAYGAGVNSSTETIKIRLAKQGNQLTLTKIIPASFLSSAVYPVRTDTTDTFYGYRDGYVNSSNATYSTARAGSGLFATSNNFQAGQLDPATGWTDGTNWWVRQIFVQFDTSSINDAATITAATLSIYGRTGSAAGPVAGDVLRARMRDYGTSVDTGDFVAGASLSGAGTLVASFTAGTWLYGGSAAYNDLVSEAAFPANISKTGDTRMFLHTKYQQDGTATQSNFPGTESATAGTDKDPKLTVTYTLPAPTIASPTKTDIKGSQATLGGDVTSDGGDPITGRGVCVGTSANPALGGNCFSTSGTTGVFTVNATGLTQGTLYHYRAYATNSGGTSYTTDDTFTTQLLNSYTLAVATPQIAGVCVTGTNTITAKDSSGTTISDDTSTVNMSTSGLSVTFYTSSSCATSTTQYTLSGGTANVYYKTNKGQIMTITATKASSTETGTSSEITVYSATAYWKFDEGTGTSTNDGSGNTNTSTLGGTTLPTWQVENQCLSGKCLFFDGSTSKVTGSKVAPGLQTVSFWIRPNTIASQGLLNLDGGTHKISTNGSGVITATGFTSPTYYINGVATTTPTLTANQWNFVEITTGTAFDSTSSFTIGTDGTNFQKGFFDEVRLYSYARSADQAKTDYNSRGALQASEVLGTNTQNQPSALSNGLVGYWKMDETATPSSDSSGNSNNGTWNNNIAATTGKFGNGTTYDGTDDYIQVADSNSLDVTSVTIAAWINPTALGGVILQKATGAGGTDGYYLDTNGSKIRFCATGGCASSTTTLSTSSWQHVAVTFDGTTTKFFLNGALDGTSTTATSVAANALVLRMGVDSASGSDYNGKEDEVRVYNRALSPAEVAQLYNFAPGPVAYFNFEEHQGISANDSSGNANTGTLSGNADWTQGKYGGGVTFDGSGDIVTAGTGSSISITGAITVEAWVKVAVLPGSNLGYSIVAKDKNTGGRAYTLDLLTSAGCLGTCFRFYVNGGGNLTTNEVTATANQVQTNIWYHVVGTFVPSTSMHIYINGVQSETNTVTSPVASINTATANLTVGGREYAGAEDYFNGVIDEPRIYNYARTAGQIVEDMNAGHPAPGSPIGSPLGHWKFDEGYGTTLNNSGSKGTSIAGSSAGGAAWTNHGKFGKAIVTDGTATYATIPDDDSIDFNYNQDFTVSFWMRDIGGSTASKAIVEKWTTGGTPYPYVFRTATGNKVIFLRFDTTNNPFITSSKVVMDSAWHHIVGVKNGSTMYLYVDGVLDGTTTDSTNTTTTNTSAVQIGRRGGGSNFWSGNLDELKIYNSALTASQVKLEYNRAQSLVLGSMSDTSGLTGGNVASNSAAAEYCIPGDASTCSAPVARWDFEEGSGTSVNDTSDNANTGTWAGTAPYWIQGKYGKGGNFNGTNNDVELANSSTISPGSGDFTVEVWFKTSLSGTSQYIYWDSTDAANAPSIQFAVNGADNKLYCLYRDSESDTVTVSGVGSTVTDGAWHHSACIRNGTTARVYLDGAQIGTNTNASLGTIDVSTGRIPRIGAGAVGADVLDTPFNGRIDSVRLFTYTRSQSQITWDYNQGKPVGHWKLDECQGSTANDSSGKLNSGTITIGGSGTQTSVGTCSTASTAWGNGATGKYNYSLNLDGNDDYITTAAFSPLATAGQTTKSISWGGWFYPTSSIASKTLLEKATEFQLTTNSSSQPLCGVYYSAAFHNSSAPTQTLTLSAWNHVLCTYDGTNINTYLNGKLIKQSSETNSVTAASSILYIGETSGGGSRYSGQLDDAKIYNYALTKQQIQQVYNQGGAVRYGPATGSP